LTQSNFRMGDQPRSLPMYTQVRTKVYRKDKCWSVRLVYDSRKLPGVTIARPGQTLAVSRAHIGQLRRIW
jgi:hypothetical protein